MSEIKIPEQIDNDEYLYRGIINLFWDFENNRISSAAFKDSNGVSVDRDFFRHETECSRLLMAKNNFFAISKILTREIRANFIFVKYLPCDDNMFHSEIHESESKVKLTKSKSKILRDIAILVKTD